MPFRRKHKHHSESHSDSKPPLRFRASLSGCGCLSLLLLTITVGGWIAWQQWPFIQRRYITYPRLADTLHALERQRRPQLREDGRTDLRGVFHAHSLLSHDSMGTPAEIVEGAQRAKIDFVFLTDHPATPPKDIPPELQGEQGGITLIPGVETSQGMIAWFFDTKSVDPKATLAEQIAAVQAAGGVAAVCHPDEPRPWNQLPPFTAMEIYNLHADAKKSKLTMGYRLSENFWSMSKYPMLVYHGLFHDPSEYLAIWDKLTPQRRVVAIAGNDAHQNNGLRLIVSPSGTLVLTDTGPKISPIVEFRNWFARKYAQNKPVGATLWRWDADLYERSFHFVNTHLLATGRSPQDLRAAVEAGHAYVAFDSLVTATGFDFNYKVLDSRWIMGDEAPFASTGVFNIYLPIDGAIALERNGVKVAEAHGSELHYRPTEQGVYRVEAYIEYGVEVIPWIYSNPIYLK